MNDATERTNRGYRNLAAAIAKQAFIEYWDAWRGYQIAVAYTAATDENLQPEVRAERLASFKEKFQKTKKGRKEVRVYNPEAYRGQENFYLYQMLKVERFFRSDWYRDVICGLAPTLQRLRFETFLELLPDALDQWCEFKNPFKDEILQEEDDEVQNEE